MRTNVLELLPYEKEALLEALRRDLRSEMSLTSRNACQAIWHQRNMRLSLRLLEAINPKSRNVVKPNEEISIPEIAFANERSESKLEDGE